MTKCDICNTELTDRGTCPNWRAHPRPNAGRPPLDEPISQRNISLFERQWEIIERFANECYNGNVSAAMREIFEESLKNPTWL